MKFFEVQTPFGDPVLVVADRFEWGIADSYLRFYANDELVAQFNNPLYLKQRLVENKA